MSVAVQSNNNFGKFINTYDVDDPDYVKELLRPPEVKEDVRLMSQRRRVSLVLKSEAFRKGLERITASHMKSGQLSDRAVALQSLVDYLTPHARFGASSFTRCSTIPVIPINDFHGVHPEPTISKTERLIRCKVASVFRLMDIFGWNVSSQLHVTMKLVKDVDEFLINPNGLMFSELTASSLVKVNLEGQILDPGSCQNGIDKAGWLLHSAVHEAKPEIRCIVHVCTPSTSVISSLGQGLLPLSQEALIVGEVAYFESVADETRNLEQEKAAVRAALDAKPANCRALMIKNHGFLALGTTVEEAWSTAYHISLACESQLRLACVDVNELILPSAEAQQSAYRTAHNPAEVNMGSGSRESNWRVGEMEFEALMRRLDAAGYRTGHLYRIAQVKKSTGLSAGDERALSPRKAASLSRKARSPREQIEIPPTCSSFATAFYEDPLAKERAAIKAKTMSLSRHWANTPNAYQKRQFEEKGTANPRMITQWHCDDEDDDDKGAETDPEMSRLRTRQKRRAPRAKHHTLTSGVSFAVEDPNSYAPQGLNPRELKQNQMRVRSNYYSGVCNPGPKSRILCALDGEEMGGYFSDGALSPVSSPGSPVGTLMRLDPKSPPKMEPGHVVLVGAVSKGIIKSDARHNVSLYQSIYQPNPFHNFTDEDLERYKTNVERKQKGLCTLEEEEAKEALRKQVEEAKLAAEARDQVIGKSAGPSHSSPAKKSLFGRAVKSDTSGAEATEDTDGGKERDGKKKKRRFKLPSFGIKSKDRKKKGASDEQ